MPYFEEIKSKALNYSKILKHIKQENAFLWYPYDIMSNIWHMDSLLTGENRNIFDKVKSIADIGAADGDLGYFFESIGFSVDFIDYSKTNYNKMDGLKTLRQLFNSKANIHDVDLDSQFNLPGSHDLAVFFGILYHLKNPFYVLEQMAKRYKLCMLSTRVAKYYNGHRLDECPIAYLCGSLEVNQDDTNYWIFSESGLKKILFRTHWDILDFYTAGEPESDALDKDERAYCLLKSRHF